MKSIKVKDLRITSKSRAKFDLPYDPYEVLKDHHYISEVNDEFLIGIYSQNQEMIRNYLQHTELLASSKYSKVFKSKVALQDKFVAVKQEDTEYIVHEAVVGALALNSFRDFIPNFAKVYGYISCGTWVQNSEKTVEWCNYPNAQTNYVFYEMINGETLSKFISVRRSVATLLKILLCIAYTLKLARETFKFTHYDFHDKNVMIVTLPEEVEIDYTYAKIQTRYVPIIIDYGYSHVKVNGVDYGVNFKKYHIFNNVGSETLDLFKLIGTAADTSDAKRSGNYDFFKNVFAFFSDDIENILKKYDYHIFYASAAALGDRTIDGFIEHLSTSFEEEMDVATSLKDGVKDWRELLFVEPKMIATNIMDVIIARDLKSSYSIRTSNEKEFDEIENREFSAISEKISEVKNQLSIFSKRRRKDRRAVNAFVKNIMVDYYYLKRASELLRSDDLDEGVKDIKDELERLMATLSNSKKISPSVFRKFRKL